MLCEECVGELCSYYQVQVIKQSNRYSFFFYEERVRQFNPQVVVGKDTSSTYTENTR